MIIQQILAIDEITPGMRLAASAADAGGHVLLPAGTELTESMLQSLRRRDIAELLIEAKIVEDPAVVEARRAGLKKQIEQLFRKAGTEPETMALHQAILDFRMERGA